MFSPEDQENIKLAKKDMLGRVNTGFDKYFDTLNNPYVVTGEYIWNALMFRYHSSVSVFVDSVLFTSMCNLKHKDFYFKELTYKELGRPLYGHRQINRKNDNEYAWVWIPFSHIERIHRIPYLDTQGYLHLSPHMLDAIKKGTSFQNFIQEVGSFEQDWEKYRPISTR